MCGHPSTTNPSLLLGIMSSQAKTLDADKENYTQLRNSLQGMNSLACFLWPHSFSSAFSCTLKGRVGGWRSGVIDPGSVSGASSQRWSVFL